MARGLSVDSSDSVLKERCSLHREGAPAAVGSQRSSHATCGAIRIPSASFLHATLFVMGTAVLMKLKLSKLCRASWAQGLGGPVVVKLLLDWQLEVSL